MAEMNSREHRQLEHECMVFCRYLVKQDPTDYVRAKYRAGVSALLKDRTPSRLDAALVRIAGSHPLVARLADAYARFVLPRSLLRSKLVLLLAILESAAPTEEKFRRTSSAPAFLVIGSLVLHTIAFALTLLLALVVFLPVHLLLLLRREKEPSPGLVAVERS